MKLQPHPNATHLGETWLEPEELCYPNGGMNRRCRCRWPDGKLRIVRCGIHDTFFSIPVRRGDADGYICVNNEEYQLVEYAV